jgi:hypothetical protein
MAAPDKPRQREALSVWFLASRAAMRLVSSCWKSIALSCAAAALLATACGRKPSDRSVSSVAANLPGCKAAIAKVDYENGLVIPGETKSVIESCRS